METTCPACGHAFEVEPDRLTSDVLRFGPFVLDLDKGIFARDDVEVRLPRIEWLVLAYLARERDRVVSWQRIAVEVNGSVHELDYAGVNTWLSRVRGYGLGPYIQNYPRRGWRFLTDGSAHPKHGPDGGS